MALQAIKHGVPFPMWPLFASGDLNLTQTNYLMDAASEKVAVIGRATAAKAIRKIWFRTVTVTTGATIDVRVETVDASGNPSGTLWATNTNVSHVVNATDDSVWLQTAALTADATLALGDLFALVLVQPGASFGDMTITQFPDDAALNGFPYGAVYTGSWAHFTGGPFVIAEYSDGSFEPMLGATARGAINTNTFNSGSTPDERGLKFKVPFPCRVNGCWAYMNSTGDFVAKLYDSDGTSVLASLTVANASLTRQAVDHGPQFFPFTTTATLAKDTYYRLTIVPSSVTNLVTFDFDVPSAAFLDSLIGGQNVHHTERTNAGAWTDTTTKRDVMGVFFDAFDDGVGGGGAGGGAVFGASGGVIT